MKWQKIEEKFDNGEDVSEHFDWSRVRHPNQGITHTEIDLPVWMLRNLDGEASRLGVTRETLIQRWIEEKLNALHISE